MASKASIFFIAALLLYAFAFALYLEYFYETAPYGTEIIHVLPLLTWLACLFFTSPLGHALNSALQLHSRAQEKVGDVPILRRSLLLLGMLVQSICFAFDVLCLAFFFSCEAPYCPPLGSRLFGAALTALILLNFVVIVTAGAKLKYSFELEKFPRSWNSEELRDRLRVVRVIVHCTRLLFFVVLLLHVAEASVSVPDKFLAGLASVLDIEWLTLCLLAENDASFEMAACDILRKAKMGTVMERGNKALKEWMPDLREDRRTFYTVTVAHFVLNGGLLAILLLKRWLLPSLLNRALLILTLAVLFFTAHDRFGLTTAIETCAPAKLPVVDKREKRQDMQPMRVESSYTMRSRLKSFKIKF